MTVERLGAAKFETYGASHLAVLGIFAIGVVAVILLGRSLRNIAGEVALRRTFAVAIVAVALPLQVLQFIPSEWDLQTSLPLALCD